LISLSISILPAPTLQCREGFLCDVMGRSVLRLSPGLPPDSGAKTGLDITCKLQKTPDWFAGAAIRKTA
jgi:hypothetical protein